jgi:hypothetical protein
MSISRTFNAEKPASEPMGGDPCILVRYLGFSIVRVEDLRLCLDFCRPFVDRTASVPVRNKPSDTGLYAQGVF